MGGERPNSGQKMQVEVALLKQNMTVLEHTVISQNSAVKVELGEMNRVLREIHDKLDRTILDQAVQLTSQKYEIAAANTAIAKANTEISKVNGKIAKAMGFMSALVLTVVGGLFQWFSPGGGK